MLHQVLQNTRILRLEKGISQDEMAVLVGVSQSAYARFESGATRLDFVLLEKISNILNINIEELIYHHLKEDPSSYFHHFNERFLKLVKETSHWKERTAHFEKLIKRFEDQLKDKNEIIQMLKSELLRDGDHKRP